MLGNPDAAQLSVLHVVTSKSTLLQPTTSCQITSQLPGRTSSEAGYQQTVGRGQSFVTRPGITVSGQAGPTGKEVSQPCNNPQAQFVFEVLDENVIFCPVEAVSLAQIHGDYGIDVCLSSSSGQPLTDQTMVWMTASRGETRQLQMVTQRRKVVTDYHISENMPCCFTRKRKRVTQRKATVE